MNSRPSAPALGVRLEHVGLRYHNQILVDDLSLELEAGRWTCLLGPSGSGKTTLLRFIAGLMSSQTSAGRALGSDGRPLAGRVTYMAQQDLLLPWLSVHDNATLGNRLRGEAPDPRAHALLEAVGLAAYAAELPHTLSGGMRQRAALARTLIEDRPVILMDEPFSSLDAVTRHRLQALAAELLSGRTTLLVTHDPLEALRLGHRIVLMTSGDAKLDEVSAPRGRPPRALDAPGIAHSHAELLSRLAANAPP